jgi:hypothetical protein
MDLSKEYLCEKLSEDYADRASKGGANYDDAYSHYMERCLSRDEENLSKQYVVQGLQNKTNEGFILNSALL